MKESKNSNKVSEIFELKVLLDSFSIKISEKRRKHFSTDAEKYLFFVFDCMKSKECYRLQYDYNLIIKEISKYDGVDSLDLMLCDFKKIVGLYSLVYHVDNISKFRLSRICKILLLESEILLIQYKNAKATNYNKTNKGNNKKNKIIVSKNKINRRFKELHRLKKLYFYKARKSGVNPLNIQLHVNLKKYVGKFFIKKELELAKSRINFCDNTFVELDWYEDRFVINQKTFYYNDLYYSSDNETDKDVCIVHTRISRTSEVCTHIKIIDGDEGVTYIRNNEKDVECISWKSDCIIVHLKSGDIVMNYEDLK